MDPGTVASAGGYWAAINRVVDNTYSSTAPSVIRTNVGGVIRTDQDGTHHYHQLLSLTNNIPWPFSDDETSILERPCYIECFDALSTLISSARAKRCVYFMVSGSSGIGKTVEIYEMIAKIVSNYLDTLGANAVPQPGDANRPTFGLRLSNSSSVLYFHYNEQAQPEVVEMEMSDIKDNRPHFFFTDTVPEFNTCAVIAQIHMTNMGNKHAEAEKFLESQIIHELFFLPPFSLEEFLCCSGGHCVPVDPNQNQAADPHHWDHQERCQFLFDIFGGNVRFLKHYQSSSLYFLLDDKTLISELMTEFFDEVLAANGQPVLTVYPELLQYCPKFLACEWKRAKKQRDEHSVKSMITSLFIHFVPLGEDGVDEIFASTFMSYVAGVLYSHEKTVYQGYMRQLFGNAVAGVDFERKAHFAIMRIVSGAGLVIECFDQNQPISMIQFPPLPNGQPVGTRKVFIRKWADIAGLKPYEYGFPTVSNFPLIDSIYRMPNNQGDIAFQMTLAERKQLSSAVPKEALYFGQLNKAAHPVSLVYVLDHDNYGKFGPEPRLPATHWVQWRCNADEHTQNQKRKRRRILVVPAVAGGGNDDV